MTTFINMYYEVPGIADTRSVTYEWHGDETWLEFDSAEWQRMVDFAYKSWKVDAPRVASALIEEFGIAVLDGNGLDYWEEVVPNGVDPYTARSIKPPIGLGRGIKRSD